MKKRSKVIKVLILGFCMLWALGVINVHPAGADKIEYWYDGPGRLIKAVNDLNGKYVSYEYDNVGNLISIANGTTGIIPPVLQNISQDVLIPGTTIPVTIRGLNLFTTRDMISDNAALSFGALKVTDSEINTELTVLSNALPGTVTITVFTIYGSASIQAVIAQGRVIFSPDILTLRSGGSFNVTAGIEPPVGRDIEILINNSNPSLVSVPNSIVIPSGGSSYLPVSAYGEGIAHVRSGETEIVVFVLGNFAVNSAPVSITLANTYPIASLPVSIIRARQDVPVFYQTTPVSVAVTNNRLTLAAQPISVTMASAVRNGIVITPPVSVQILSQ